MTATPVLPSLDLQRTANFFQQYFNCKATWYDEYIVLTNQKFQLHFWKCNDPYLCINSGCYVRVADIETLYLQLNIPGVIHPNGHLETKPWGMKEFAITDPDGNLLRIGEQKIEAVA